MHMEDLRSMEVHSINQRSWRHPCDDGDHALKDLRQHCGDVVFVLSGLMIVHSDGVEQRKSMICERTIWKMREDRAMGLDNRSKTIDKLGRQMDLGQSLSQC
jgi:hypothetical protein